MAQATLCYGDSAPLKRWHSTPSFRPMSIVDKRSPISATAELLLFFCFAFSYTRVQLLGVLFGFAMELLAHIKFPLLTVGDRYVFIFHLEQCHLSRCDDLKPLSCLWSPYVIGQTIILLPCDFYLSSYFFFFSSPNLSGVDWMSAILLHIAWP